MLTKILSAAFIFFAVIAMLPGIFKARKRYWVECISRIIIIVSSAFLAAYVTSLLSYELSKLLLSFLASAMTGTSLDGILAEIPSAEKVIAALLAFTIANLIFFIIYTIIKAIAKPIFTKPLTKLFLLIGGAIRRKDYIAEVYGRKHKKKKKKEAEAVAESTEGISTETTVTEVEAPAEEEHKAKKRKKKFCVKSALFGAICGFISYIIILVPIVAALELTAHIADLTHAEQLSAEFSEDAPAIIAEASDAIVDNIGSKTVMTIGGRQLYNLYTSVNADGEKIDVDSEITFVVEFVEGVASIANDDLTAKEMGDEIRNINNYIDDTTIIPSILSEFINEAGEDWIAGKEFHEIPRPSLGEGSDDVVISLLKCLQGSNADTIKEDLKSIINIIAVIVENPTEGGADFSAILSNKDLVSKISVEVLDNDRLAPMIKHLMVLNLSAPVPSISIDLPDENDPTYNEFVDKVVSGYLDNVVEGDTAATLDSIAGAVNNALKEHDIEVDEGIDTVVAAALISEFGDGKEMTNENLKSFISENITKYTTPANTETVA